jgi:hypothetical protein
MINRIYIAIRASGLFIALAILAIAAAAQQTYQSASVRPASITGDLLNILNANDGQLTTRANSNRPDYSGLSVTIDLGSEQNVIGVAQDHGRWPTHYPGAYKVEVAERPGGPWMLAFEGRGNRGESKAVFPAIRARYIRVTATDAKGGGPDWTIAEIKGGIDPGQTARRIPEREVDRPDTTPPTRPTMLRNSELAWDKRPNTFATSNRPDYAGMSITYDLGGEYELSRVVQLHGDRAEEFPGQYRIEVSRRPDSQYREVWSGSGERGRSVARFDPIVTRYIRITATRNRNLRADWSIAEIRTNRDPDVIDDEDDANNHRIVAVTAEGILNASAVRDNNNTTRASTNTPNYAGRWIQADLGGSYSVSRVVQIHEPDERDFPGRYRIEVSLDGRNWQRVFEGAGERARSGASFTPVRARFVRITAIQNRNLQTPWSIYKLKIRS